MICSKCQLTTAEEDLTPNHFGNPVCKPCLQVEMPRLDLPDLSEDACRKVVYDAMNTTLPKIGGDGPVINYSLKSLDNDLGERFLAASVDVEALPRPRQPGRTVYSVQYRYEDGRKGFMDFSDVVRVERMVRIVVQDGGEVVSVSEAREMVNDEPGLTPELLPIGQWSRERIQQAIRLYPDVKREIKNKATKAYYGKTETIVTGVTSFKREYGEAFLAGEEAAKKSLRSSSASPNFANIRNKESVEEHLDKRCRELRRVKAFGVDRNRVLDFLTKGCRYATEDIPADVEILEVHEDPMRRMFVFTLRHDSFPPVPEGQVLEMIRPVWEVDTSDRDLLGDMLNLVERAVQIHSQHLEPEIAEEYFKRAQEVCQRLHGKGLK